MQVTRLRKVCKKCGSVDIIYHRRYHRGCYSAVQALRNQMQQLKEEMKTSRFQVPGP